MLRRRQINRDLEGRSVRFFAGLADAARWPFERLAWSLERRLLWPLQERLAGWNPGSRGAGVAALATIAACAVLAGVLLLPAGNGAPSERSASATRVAVATPERQQQAERPAGPVLHGKAPDFAVAPGVGVSQASDGAAAELNAGAGSPPPPAASEEASQPEAGAATTSATEKPVPAGPAAMKVARRFSEAFVFYEIGERPAQAKAVFGETATPQLATALGERPPRLPADAEVPRARVVNLVPGPRAGRAYTVSVSLLRVGLTTELRLELNKKAGDWLVTDVRG
jgi:hypothetical protein